MKQKLYGLYDWKKAVGIIGLLYTSSIFVDLKIVGSVLIFMGIINFGLVTIDFLNKKRKRK